MYPVAPACLILFVKPILDILSTLLIRNSFVYVQELPLIDETHNRAGGGLPNQTKSYPTVPDIRIANAAIGLHQVFQSLP